MCVVCVELQNIENGNQQEEVEVIAKDWIAIAYKWMWKNKIPILVLLLITFVLFAFVGVYLFYSNMKSTALTSAAINSSTISETTTSAAGMTTKHDSDGIWNLI